MKSLHVYYEGKVQGVGFRASVLSLAKGYDVTGWVRNLPDGRVEVFMHGEGNEVDDFFEGIAESHLAGHIEHATMEPGSPEQGIKGFRIID